MVFFFRILTGMSQINRCSTDIEEDEIAKIDKNGRSH